MLGAKTQFDAGRHLARFLAEDIGKGDITSALLPRGSITGTIVTRQEAVVAGARRASELFALKGCKSRILRRDGLHADRGQALLRVTGEARHLLACERTALNLMSRMSGIATQTRTLVSKLPKGVNLYSTRKTAPGMRHFDKEAVVAGGGKRHRLTLDEMVLIKDNHIAAAGSRGDSLERLVRKAVSKHTKVEVEVESVTDAVLAARCGASIIMLDNFAPSRIRDAVSRLKGLGLRRGVGLEASGGITARNISRYASTGVDMISVGSLTSSVVGIDMSLEIAPMH